VQGFARLKKELRHEGSGQEAPAFRPGRSHDGKHTLLRIIQRNDARHAISAVKQGEDPDAPECKAQYKEMRNAVKSHNKKFEKPTK
jgi:hypothetical protein